MFSPHTIQKESFQLAWIEAVKLIQSNNWQVRNLTVQILNPSALNNEIHQKVIDFAMSNDILKPKQVAYTIFPLNLYKNQITASQLFFSYNRPRGFYARIKRRSRKINWGTYFRRMTHYNINGGTLNQSAKIIDSINNRAKIYKGTYTIIIQDPEKEPTRPRGGPCLNFMVVQLEPIPRKTLGLLCIYRNQDFYERAYGNYWGLCNLLIFFARETNSAIGPLTCVSSHAYVDRGRNSLARFIDDLD